MWFSTYGAKVHGVLASFYQYVALTGQKSTKKQFLSRIAQTKVYATVKKLNRMKKIILYSLLNLFMCVACGQNIAQTHLQDSLQNSLFEQSLKFRVKQVDEFIARFNYEIDTEGKKVQNRLDMQARKKQIASLFDAEYIKKVDAKQKQVIVNFINQVCGGDSSKQSKFWLISLYDKDFYAKAICKVKYLGKDETLQLTLKIEQDEKKNLRWVIVAAEAKFLEVVPKDTTKSISPVNHELNFMELSKITEQDAANIAAYTAKNYEVEQLSILLFLIKNKQLKIDFVQQLSFHFSQVQNYTFIVEHKERTKGNVGWLITDIQEKERSE